MPPGGPFLPLSGGTVSGPLNYTATGGTTSRSAQDRANTAALTVEDFGAKGDAIADDTAAFNAYAAYLRALPGYGTLYTRFTLGSSRTYSIAGSVNLTGLSNVIFEGNGSLIVANATVAGTSMLDAVQSSGITFQNLGIYSANANCKYGIQVGRPLNPAAGATNITFINLWIAGLFSGACIYNRAAEISNYLSVQVTNQANSPTAYGIIMDGDCSFPITSQFAATYNPSAPTVADGLAHGTLMSNNQMTFVGCSLVSQYSPAVWMSNLRGHHYINSYTAGFLNGAGTSSPAAIISYAAGGAVSDLYWECLSEGPVTNIFRIDGAVAAPLIRTLYVRMYYLSSTGPVFRLGAGVSTLTIHDLELHIDNSVTTPINVFDNGANYALYGVRAYLGANINFNAQYSQGYVNANGTFPNSFNVGGSLTIGGDLYTPGNATIGAAVVANAATVSTPGGSALLNLESPVGSFRGIEMFTGTTPRWIVAADNTAEGGADSGSNLAIYRYNDAGTTLNAAMTVARSTGVVNFASTPTVAGVPIPAPPVVNTVTTPLMDGTATIGTLTTYARPDHVHPTDTSRAPTASPTFTGTVTATGATTNVGALTATSVTASAGAHFGSVFGANAVDVTKHLDLYGGTYGVGIASDATTCYVAAAGHVFWIGGASAGSIGSAGWAQTVAELKPLPAAKTGTSYTVAATDCSLVLTPTGTFTLTLPAASSSAGRIIRLKNTAAFAINSASSNIVQLIGGAATAAIMPATAGKFCMLQSDGTAWQLMEAN